MFVSFVVIPSGVTFCMDINCEKKKMKKRGMKKKKKRRRKSGGQKSVLFCSLHSAKWGRWSQRAGASIWEHGAGLTLCSPRQCDDTADCCGCFQRWFRRRVKETWQRNCLWSYTFCPSPLPPPHVIPPNPCPHLFLPTRRHHPHKKKSFKKCEKQQHGNGVVCKLSCSVPLLIDLLGKRRF